MQQLWHKFWAAVLPSLDNNDALMQIYGTTMIFWVFFNNVVNG